MSACRRQAVSQVGCRLMVASSAKISRPRNPVAPAGPRLLTAARNASTSPRDEAAGAGSPPRRTGVASRGLSAIGTRLRRHIRPAHSWSCPMARAMAAGTAGSGVDHVVQIERLILGREPLGAGGGAALPALVNRQLQFGDQRHDLLAR